jgi:hypothetical protein
MTQVMILMWIWAWRMVWTHWTALILTAMSIWIGTVTMNRRKIRRRKMRTRRMWMRMMARNIGQLARER